MRYRKDFYSQSEYENYLRSGEFRSILYEQFTNNRKSDKEVNLCTKLKDLEIFWEMLIENKLDRLNRG